MNLEDFNRFINKFEWTFAKTYVTAPHEYIIRWKLPEEEHEAFKQAVEFINQNGKPEWFWKKQYIYLRLDGYKYWAMTLDESGELNIINRTKYESGNNHNPEPAVLPA